MLMLWLALGCRGYHEPVDYADCQPYTLQCPSCRYEDDASIPDTTRRDGRCEDSLGEAYDFVDRRALDAAALDTHYYTPETGLREAARRLYDEEIDVCGTTTDVEWYGLILEDCEPVCEHQRLPDSDGGLPDCDSL